AGGISDAAHCPDVVVVTVREEDGAHCAPGDRIQHRLRVVRRVDDHALGVVPEDPDVVVHLPGAAVEGERAAGDEVLHPHPAAGIGALHSHRTSPPVGAGLISTTERSTFPAVIFSNAGSTSSMPMRSVTKPSRSSRPRRYCSTSIGKSREGRQSPYQADLIDPPRPNTSSSGSSQVVPGSGTPTSTTRPARSRASKACLNVAAIPTASITRSAPKPPVSARTASTGSWSPAFTVSVAPKRRA